MAGETGAREVYQRPKLKNEDEVHVQGVTGKTTIKRIDALDRLLASGEITGQEFCAALDMMRIVSDYYTSASGLSRVSEEAPNAGSSTDPIRRYVKARAAREVNGKVVGYIPTQKPRNVSRTRASFDGWNTRKSDALAEMHRLRAVLRMIPPESLRVLYALVIHPGDPHKRNITLTAYMLKAYGYKGGKCQMRVVGHLRVALATLHKELGERMEQAA